MAKDWCDVVCVLCVLLFVAPFGWMDCVRRRQHILLSRTIGGGIIHVHTMDLLIVLNSHLNFGSIPFGCTSGQPPLVAVPVPGLRKYVSFTTLETP